ncbi:isoprenylcysteine carboxyl methyltransferase (ICMT) family protein [mine drainage metagenome]|uniref:Isoprenylcysteine carboxyl methyltransferase (ICMT) family protein n=1 Tax=mine drainage metagenome TaxID=410659 RepID=A0A1J5SFZ0_9ZZZZ
MIKKADKIYVSIQALLFILYIIPIKIFQLHIVAVFRYAGILFSLTGILIASIALLQLNKFLTAFPTPKQNSRLLKSGVYKYVRHPVYSGIILTSTGYGLFAQDVWKLLIAASLFILFYFKSKYEESLLLKHFKQYEAYQKNSYRFFPFL